MRIQDVFSKKKKVVKTPEYEIGLEKELDENKIPYEIETDDETDVMKLMYLDPFEKVSLSFDCIDDEYILNEKSYDESEAFNLILAKWKTDKVIREYMDDDVYTPLFDMYEFFDNITSDGGLIGRVIPFKDKKGLKLYYNIRRQPTEIDHIAGVEFVPSEGEDVYTAFPSGMKVDANAAILEILNQIYKIAPLFFTSGTYRIPDDTVYTDIVKTYLINLALVNRLNELDGIEAQITDIGNSNIIFVAFENNSGLEYISSTKQNPKGNILLMDFDEDNKVEDNEEFESVSKILQLSSMIKDKPDENNMPKRNFSKKVPNRR